VYSQWFGRNRWQICLSFVFRTVIYKGMHIFILTWNLCPHCTFYCSIKSSTMWHHEIDRGFMLKWAVLNTRFIHDAVCQTHVMNQKLTNISLFHQPDKNMLRYPSILLKLWHLTCLSNYEMISHMMQSLLYSR
jgi:hypothetical protein